MTNRQTNRLNMFIVVHDFFKENDALFNTKPHFVSLITDLKDTIDAIIREAGISTEDNTGYAIKKGKTRIELETVCGKVANAMESYCTGTAQVSLIEAEDYLPSALANAPDSDVYVLACQLQRKAEPVKNLLPPYNSGPADVALINTIAETFLPQIKGSRNLRKERSRSIKKLANYYKHVDELLEKSDTYMSVYQFVQNDLWLSYKLSRKITDSASGHTVHKKRGQVLPGFVLNVPFSAEVLKAAAKLDLSNTGKSGELIFYFSKSSGVRPGSSDLTFRVASGKTLKTTMAEAGYTVYKPFLNVFNPNVRHVQWKAEVGK